MNKYENEPFAKALSHVMNSRKWGTGAKCAKKIRISSGYLSELKVGKKEGGEKHRRAIAEYWGYPYDDFLALGQHLLDGGSYESWRGAESLTPREILATTSNTLLATQSLKKVPLISWVKAGEFCETIDSCQPNDADEWIHTTANTGENAYALTIKGDSMETEFYEGERIIVDPSRQPENGSYVIVRIGEGKSSEATFKKIIYDGDKVYLKAENPEYGMRDMTDTPFVICGVVVEKNKTYV